MWGGWCGPCVVARLPSVIPHLRDAGPSAARIISCRSKFQADISVQKRKVWLAEGALAPHGPAVAVVAGEEGKEIEAADGAPEQQQAPLETLGSGARRDGELDALEQEMLRVFTAHATFGRGVQAGELALRQRAESIAQFVCMRTCTQLPSQVSLTSHPCRAPSPPLPCARQPRRARLAAVCKAGARVRPADQPADAGRGGRGVRAGGAPG